jgi:hypothetical protein
VKITDKTVLVTSINNAAPAKNVTCLDIDKFERPSALKGNSRIWSELPDCAVLIETDTNAPIKSTPMRSKKLSNVWKKTILVNFLLS